MAAAEQVDRRSFALVATWESSDVAVVEIDRELFLTLIEAERGLGRSSWSRTATRRITRFIDRIHGVGRARVADRGHPHPQRRERPRRAVRDPARTGEVPVVTPVDTKELLESVFDEEFGFRLTNFSIKPVHVANGLARALSGRTYDTTAVTRLVRRYVRNQKLGVDEERYPNAEVIADYASAFASSKGHEPDALKVTRLRSLAFDVLAADGAVFPTQQSFTLSNERFITSDLSDVRMGLFLVAAADRRAGGADRGRRLSARVAPVRERPVDDAGPAGAGVRRRARGDAERRGGRADRQERPSVRDVERASSSRRRCATCATPTTASPASSATPAPSSTRCGG